MKKYIRSSMTTFDTTDSINKAVKNVFGNYIVSEEFLSGSKQYLYKLEGYGVSILVGRVDKSDRIPGALYSGSMADNMPCVMKITDSTKTQALLDACKQNQFSEACNYRNSQWGTYKIEIRTYSDLKRLYKIYVEFIRGTLEG